MFYSTTSPAFSRARHCVFRQLVKLFALGRGALLVYFKNSLLFRYSFRVITVSHIKTLEAWTIFSLLYIARLVNASDRIAFFSGLPSLNIKMKSIFYANTDNAPAVFFPRAEGKKYLHFFLLPSLALLGVVAAARF